MNRSTWKACRSLVASGCLSRTRTHAACTEPICSASPSRSRRASRASRAVVRGSCRCHVQWQCASSRCTPSRIPSGGGSVRSGALSPAPRDPTPTVSIHFALWRSWSGRVDERASACSRRACTCPRARPAAVPLADRQFLAGKVYKQLVADFVLDMYRHLVAVTPHLKVIAELRVAEPGRRKVPCVLAHYRMRYPQCTPDLSIAEPVFPQTNNVSDLAHADPLVGHGRLLLPRCCGNQKPAR